MTKTQFNKLKNLVHLNKDSNPIRGYVNIGYGSAIDPLGKDLSIPLSVIGMGEI